MYTVYDYPRRTSFQCTHYELLSHSLPDKHYLWVKALHQHTLPCLIFGTFPSAQIQTYLSDTNGEWIPTVQYGIYAVFKSSKHLDTFRLLFPEENASLPVDSKRPLFDARGQLTVTRFFRDLDSVEVENLLFSPKGKILASHYSTWIKVLFILINRYKHTYSDKGRELWIRFSKQCPAKFDLDMCHRLWEKTTPNDQGLQLGSLIHLLH